MRYVLILTVMMFVIGCDINSSRIPSGIYTSSEPGSEEKIEIKGSEIIFHIKMNGVFWDSQFEDHFVYSDGTVGFLPISSIEFDHLHRQYNWMFDGTVITIEEIKTGEKTSFAKNENKEKI